MSKNRHKNAATVAKSPGELAKALNLDPSISIEWEIRHEVSTQILNNFEVLGLKVTEVAKRAETSRARVTRILKGDTKGISLDVLLRILGATGQKIEIKFLRVG